MSARLRAPSAACWTLRAFTSGLTPRSARPPARPPAPRAPLRVEYEGFKEKMLDAANPEVFAPEPLTASSPAERRWYANARSLEPPGQTLLEFFELAD